ncbi:MAG: hypothetical protein FWE88_00660 [Phycisphaerae bacterium]|nr:hypothetical protein [Phycisphaerae bacterium]
MIGLFRKRPVRAWALGLCAAVAVSFVLAWPTAVLADSDAGVLLDDARISGRSVRLFQQDGQQVVVVTGNFRMTIGRRTLTSQNAVVWATDRVVGGVTRNELVVYLEGRALVTEPDGSTNTDRTMIVFLTQQGRLSLASAKPGEDPLENDELFRRAADAREDVEKPGLVRTPATAPAATAGPQPATHPAKPPRPIHVEFRDVTVKNLQDLAKRLADNDTTLTESERAMAQHATKNPRLMRAIVIIQPRIVLGNPEDDAHTTLSAEAAVMYTEQNVGPKDSHSPISVRMERLTFGQNESPVGIFLDNTVVIARNDHKLRASQAFYDLTTDRAMLIQPVYRTFEAKRNVPLYIRAAEAHQLSAREIVFKDARVSTSDFATPSYAIASQKLRIQDQTLYDDEGRAISEQVIRGEMTHATFQLEGVPIFYWPWFAGDVSDVHTPLRRASMGNNANFGVGVETNWDLFRLLGLARPNGVDATLDLAYYSKVAMAGVGMKYARTDRLRDYYGYAQLYGVFDHKREDNFGDLREHIPAPYHRSRALLRHKEYMPNDWEMQFELGYLSDRNFLEQFFRNEFWAGKDQETLLYAKKQRDNWAFTALLQARIDRFLTQTESWPDLGFYLIGQPLADGALTYYNESHLGVKRWRPDSGTGIGHSDVMARGDTRNELDAPMNLGPINITPYTVGRATYWNDKPDGGKDYRLYGQIGLRANTHIWRVYDNVHSRFWNVNGLKHIMTPEVIAWIGGAGADPDQLFPMDPGIETYLGPTSGSVIGLHQRLQTKRGEPGKEQIVDWMRLNVFAMFLDDTTDTNRQPSVGQYYFHRPEYSLGPNSLLADYAWHISDSTAFLSDINVNLNDGRIGQFNAGFAVQRDPRLRYYLGTRIIDDMNTALGIVGVSYRLNKIYTVSFFEQYDFRFQDGRNLLTTLSVIRKFPRWYTALSVSYDRTNNGMGIYVTIWPEGAPEAHLGSGRFNPLGSSDRN